MRKRLTLTLALTSVGVFLSAGCSGDDLSAKEPSMADIEEGLGIHTIQLEDGRSVECILFTADGAYTSWLAFDCDWDTVTEDVQR